MTAQRDEPQGGDLLYGSKNDSAKQVVLTNIALGDAWPPHTLGPCLPIIQHTLPTAKRSVNINLLTAGNSTSAGRRDRQHAASQTKQMQ